MYYVYIIKSIQYPEVRYVGFTADLEARLKKHNEGGSVHTTRCRPWELVASVIIPDKGKALAFERYLKSHSGRAFAQKRF